VGSGTLTTELRPVGLGPVPAALAAAAPKRSGDKPDQRKQAADDARELKAAVAAETATHRELDAALRALERAEQAYARAREAADAAAEREKEVRARLRKARAGFAEAQRRRARLQRDR
jgi:hypothetical protein